VVAVVPVWGRHDRSGFAVAESVDDLESAASVEATVGELLGLGFRHSVVDPDVWTSLP
jgi:hypothetical protein